MSAGGLFRGGAPGAAQALRPTGSSAAVWAAAVTQLAAVEGGAGAVGVAGRVGLGAGVRSAG